ncbi:MAG TPA: hypothetical protein VLA43_01610 [Longimicrobiales bacterium]|nr:hypothetical protein [Longimicrobiales bacterium]
MRIPGLAAVPPLTVDAREGREEALEGDARILAFIALVGAGFSLLFIPLDRQLVLGEHWQRVVLLVRVTMVFVSLALAARLWNPRSVREFHRVATEYLGLVFLVTFLVNSARPPAWNLFVVWDVMLIMALFTLVRIPLLNQVVLAGGFIGADTWLLFTRDVAAPAATPWALTFYLLLALALGIVMSRFVEAERRARWEGFAAERRALVEVNRVTAEFRALQARAETPG